MADRKSLQEVLADTVTKGFGNAVIREQEGDEIHIYVESYRKPIRIAKDDIAFPEEMPEDLVNIISLDCRAALHMYHDGKNMDD